MRKDTLFVLVLCIVVGLIFFGFLFMAHTADKQVFKSNSYVAKDLLIVFEPDPCDPTYLGTYQVEKYGKMELFCEDGVYFGEIDDFFSISMKEFKQKGFFSTVFCINDECFYIPVLADGATLVDVSGEHVKAAKDAPDS